MCIRDSSTSAPLVGFLTTATALPDGAEVDVTGWSTALLEPEVALRIDRELRPGADETEIRAAVGAFGAAIELADLEPTTEVERILAGDIFHRHVLLGDLTEPASGLDEVSVTVEIDGETHTAGADPKEANGDFAGLLGSLLPQLELIGETLQPGDIVITGSAVPPLLIEAGQAVTVSLSTGSPVGVKFS